MVTHEWFYCDCQRVRVASANTKGILKKRKKNHIISETYDKTQRFPKCTEFWNKIEYMYLTTHSWRWITAGNTVTPQSARQGTFLLRIPISVLNSIRTGKNYFLKAIRPTLYVYMHSIEKKITTKTWNRYFVTVLEKFNTNRVKPRVYLQHGLFTICFAHAQSSDWKWKSIENV